MEHFPTCAGLCEKPELESRAARMGCFSDLVGDRSHDIAGMKLKRCPRFYIEKQHPEEQVWIEAMFILRRAFHKGNLSTYCPNPSYKTLQAINLLDQELEHQDRKFQAALVGAEMK